MSQARLTGWVVAGILACLWLPFYAASDEPADAVPSGHTLTVMIKTDGGKTLYSLIIRANGARSAPTEPSDLNDLADLADLNSVVDAITWWHHSTPVNIMPVGETQYSVVDKAAQQLRRLGFTEMEVMCIKVDDWFSTPACRAEGKDVRD